MSWLEKHSDHAYALLRIVSGLLIAFHGIQKLFGVLSGFRAPAGSQLWIGGILELLGGLAILVGFRARQAAFVLSGMMAVAYLQFHWKFQFGAAFWPAVNKGELAVVYCFVLLFMSTRNAGTWCLDKQA